MSIIVCDCQTSGDDPEKHQVIGLALIKCSHAFEVSDELKMNILYENVMVNPKAIAYNKVDLRNYTDWVTEEDARRAVFKFLQAPEDLDKNSEQFAKKHVYAGLNVNFDIPFVRNFLTPRAFKKIFRYRPYDALGVYDFLYRIGVVAEARSDKLIDLAESLGVKIDKKKLASGDPIVHAQVTRKVCREMDRIAGGLAELVSVYGYGIPHLLKTNDSVAKNRNKALREARQKITELLEKEDKEKEQ